MYWEEESNVLNAETREKQRPKRFSMWMEYLHLADNNILMPNNRIAMNGPLLVQLNERFLKFFTTGKISINESMIHHYGDRFLKQFIRGIAIRFRYKAWTICTPLGYAIQLEPF